MSELCRKPQSCVGCCGRDFGSHHELALVLLQNSQELREAKSLEEFRDRTKHLRHGLCANAVFLQDGTIGCPLHPSRNASDLRTGHCDTTHLCSAAQQYELWTEEERKRFIEFLTHKKLSWYDYSVGMDNGTLLKEFLGPRKRGATS